MAVAGRADFLNPADHFMAAAILASKSSQDPNTQVGACIVKDNKIVGVGCNGMPKGCENFSWAREPKDELDNKHLYVCHAELNAIMTTADVKGCTIYVTLFPCNGCAKLIIQGGMKEVVFLCDKFHDRVETMASRKLLDAAEIPYTQFESTRTIIIDFNVNN